MEKNKFKYDDILKEWKLQCAVITLALYDICKDYPPIKTEQKQVNDEQNN
jgi:hypothetical protein